MQYVITKQIAVEAETPEEAVSKINEGQTIALNVNLRQQPQQSTVIRPTPTITGSQPK